MQKIYCSFYLKCSIILTSPRGSKSIRGILVYNFLVGFVNRNLYIILYYKIIKEFMKKKKKISVSKIQLNKKTCVPVIARCQHAATFDYQTHHSLALAPTCGRKKSYWSQFIFLLGKNIFKILVVSLNSEFDLYSLKIIILVSIVFKKYKECSLVLVNSRSKVILAHVTLNRILPSTYQSMSAILHAQITS